MLTCNIDVSDGLTNGAMGTITGIVQKQNKHYTSYLCNSTVIRLEIMQNQIVNTKTETVMLYPLKSGKGNLKLKNTMSEFYEHNSH